MDTGAEVYPEQNIEEINRIDVEKIEITARTNTSI